MNVVYHEPEEIERVFYNEAQNQDLSYVKFILLCASFNSRIARDSGEIRDTDMLKWVKRGDSRYRERYDHLIKKDPEFQNLINELRPIHVINFMELKMRAKALSKGKLRKVIS